MDNPVFDRGSPESVPDGEDNFQEENKPLGQPGGSPEPYVEVSRSASPELLLSKSEEGNSGVKPDKNHVFIDPEAGLAVGNEKLANGSEGKSSDT